MICIYGAGALGREVRAVLLRDSWPGNAVLMLDDFGDLQRPETVNPAGQRILMCIADPEKREAAWKRVGHRFSLGELPHALHIAGTASLADGCILMPGCVISADANVGWCCVLGFHATVGHDVQMGDYCTLSSHVDLCGGVTLGDRVFLGSGARVIPGVTVGADAYIGAGSVVVHDLLPGARVFGNPARQIGPSRFGGAPIGEPGAAP